MNAKLLVMVRIKCLTFSHKGFSTMSKGTYCKTLSSWIGWTLINGLISNNAYSP